jgi:hypothetical protein
MIAECIRETNAMRRALRKSESKRLAKASPSGTWERGSIQSYTELDENGEFVQDYRNVYLVANSLQEFLDSLMTHEEYDKRAAAKGR